MTENTIALDLMVVLIDMKQDQYLICEVLILIA